MRHQRRVPRQQQHRAPPTRQDALGLQQRVAGPELRFLDHEADVVGVGEPFPHLVGPVPEHDGDRVRAHRPGGADHPLDDRHSRGPVQHLGQCRPHPRALAGRQHHDVQVVGHVVSSTALARPRDRVSVRRDRTSGPPPLDDVVDLVRREARCRCYGPGGRSGRQICYLTKHHRESRRPLGRALSPAGSGNRGITSVNSPATGSIWPMISQVGPSIAIRGASSARGRQLFGHSTEHQVPQAFVGSGEGPRRRRPGRDGAGLEIGEPCFLVFSPSRRKSGEREPLAVEPRG